MVDCSTPADQQQWNPCRQRCNAYMGQRMSCNLLLTGGRGHCQWQGWCHRASMRVPDNDWCV